MPLFSVIIPAYKAKERIARCVESVLNSGKDDVEIVLVEDCSGDGTWERCEELAKQYSQVKVFHNEINRGVSYTRNRAIANATGEYLLFVDSDDYVAEEYVPTFKRLVESGVEFAVCGYYNHDEAHSGVCDVRGWDFDGERRAILKDEIEKIHAKTLLQQLWNKMFVTKKVKEKGVRFDESINIGEDTRFILDYIQKNGVESITLVNTPLYHYMRDNNSSLMYKVGYESIEEPLKNLKKMYEIKGVCQEEIEERIAIDRQKTIYSYAYLIMHNAGMKGKEKKRLILQLDDGKALYKMHRKLYWKEKIAKFLRIKK